MTGGKKKKKKKDRKPTKIKCDQRKIIKRTNFPRFTSVTLQQPIMSAAAKIVSVSSDFDVLAHRPIHMSVLRTI